jgi:hypothetical protein
MWQDKKDKQRVNNTTLPYTEIFKIQQHDPTKKQKLNSGALEG